MQSWMDTKQNEDTPMIVTVTMSAEMADAIFKRSYMPGGVHAFSHSLLTTMSVVQVKKLRLKPFV